MDLDAMVSDFDPPSFLGGNQGVAHHPVAENVAKWCAEGLTPDGEVMVETVDRCLFLQR